MTKKQRPLSKSSSGEPCHLCEAFALDEVPEFRRFRRVTSDCVPWPAGSRLGVCRQCGTIQKIVDETWKADVERVYAGYEIYRQGGGAEQAVFEQDSGLAATRSERILQRLQRQFPLAPRGRLLDVGCGNGAMLRTFSRAAPGWSLVGTELSEKYRTQVEGIERVERLFVGAPEELPGTFTLVTMIHLLEHIVFPRALLTRLRAKLEADALLVIEVPDQVQNPFDLMIADHCSHFTEASVSALLQSVGYEPVSIASDWVAKEITVVARLRPQASSVPPLEPAFASLSFVKQRLRWLDQVVQQARRMAACGTVGIFGSSIAGTWLWGELDGAVQFFVDEDPHRVGKLHLGCPVVRPEDIPPQSHVFMALPPAMARRVAERLAGSGAVFHLPTEFASGGGGNSAVRSRRAALA